MKRFLIAALVTFGASNLSAQLQRPMASPLGKTEQKVGLTDIKVEYSRPSKNDRVIFGDVVPFNELWRTGANDKTKFTASDAILFGNDTLKAGTYAIFTKPSVENWEVIFYTDYAGSGAPEVVEEEKVAYRTTVITSALNDVVETFTISLDNTTTKSAILNLSWDKTRVSLPFTVPTVAKMTATIEKVMGGPSASDYYASAEFYFKEKKDMKKALEWATKAVDLRPDAFWYVRLKSLLQAENGDYKGAIATAKLSLASAEKAENKAYVDMNKASIEEWSKKK